MLRRYKLYKGVKERKIELTVEKKNIPIKTNI